MLSGDFVVFCIQGRMFIDIIDRGGYVFKLIECFYVFWCLCFLSVIFIGSVVVSDKEQKYVVCVNFLISQLEWIYFILCLFWGLVFDQNGKIFVCLDNNLVQVIFEEGQLL